MNPITRRSFIAASLAAGSGLAFAAQPGALPNPVFIMDTWFWFAEPKPAWPDRLTFIKSLGVNAICHSIGFDESRWNEFKEIVDLVPAMGMEITTVYVGINIDDDELNPYLAQVVERVKGRKTMLHVPLTSKKFKNSDPAGDERALLQLKKAAEIAFPTGVNISLYPHFGNWAETAGDMARLAEKFEDPRLGVTLNLYHWLKVQGPDDMEGVMKTALPWLNCVTINGSQPNAKDIDVRAGILPLGQGNYDTYSFVYALAHLGYKGPIGFQGYGIGGDVMPKLAESVAVWNEWSKTIAASL
ncbi:MAG: TIM barrel protein [bacterium]|nr:TIM barrel protein [bacterium]